ncbi:MAG: hypothetical protein EAX86_04660 [Candidatus Heimdallarchaeota archaeon]|nr:hypothetical protein [Candidatus Heimdallarchaeota archaeon]
MDGFMKKWIIYTFITASIVSLLFFPSFEAYQVIAETSGYKYPTTVTDVGWTDQNYIKANDGLYAKAKSPGSSNYIEGSNFDFQNKSTTKITVKIEVRQYGYIYPSPSIKIGAYDDSGWHWSSSLTISTSWTIKSVTFNDFEINAQDVKVRVYIYSNPEMLWVHIDYVQCEVTYFNGNENNVYPTNSGGYLFSSTENIKADDGSYSYGIGSGSYVYGTKFELNQRRVDVSRIKAEIQVRTEYSAEPIYFQIGIKLGYGEIIDWSSPLYCMSTIWTDYFFEKTYDDAPVVDTEEIELHIKVTSTLTWMDLFVDYIRMDIDYLPNTDSRKIGVFFWAGDTTPDSVIDEYIGILQDEGYTKFFLLKNSLDVETDMDNIDDYESSTDTIFVYIHGHGHYYDAPIDDSATRFRSGGSEVYSSTFRTYMDSLEAGRKGFLIETCHGGGWPNDFKASPYLAMSSSDKYHVAWPYDPNADLPAEGRFSHLFWDYVASGHSATQAFMYATSIITEGVAWGDHLLVCTSISGDPLLDHYQNPQKVDYSSYTFFN